MLGSLPALAALCQVFSVILVIISCPRVLLSCPVRSLLDSSPPASWRTMASDQTHSRHSLSCEARACRNNSQSIKRVYILVHYPMLPFWSHDSFFLSRSAFSLPLPFREANLTRHRLRPTSTASLQLHILGRDLGAVKPNVFHPVPCGRVL